MRRPMPRMPLCFAAPLATFLALVLAPDGALADPPPARSADGLGAGTTAPLTLAKAAELARTRGLDVLVADAQRRGAEADVRTAGTLQNPAITVGFGKAVKYTRPDGCTGCSPWQYVVGASDQGLLFDVLAGKRALRMDVARAAVDGATASRRDVERIVVAQTKAAYAQVALAMRAVQFAETQEASMASAAALAKVRFPQVINEGELARVEAEHFDAATQVDVAKATLAANRASLGFLLGIRGGSVPEVDPAELDFRVPAELANATQEGLFKSALDHRPDLAVAAAAGRRAQASGALARRAVFPDVAVGVQYQQQGIDGAQSIQPPTVAVALTAVLPVFSQRQGEIERAAADGEAATWGLARAEAAVLADVNSGLGGFVAARSRVVRMRDQLLPARKKALDVVRAQYDRGAAPLMDWLDAQRTYATANRELNEAMAEFWAQVFALEAATGTEFSK